MDKTKRGDCKRKVTFLFDLGCARKGESVEDAYLDNHM